LEGFWVIQKSENSEKKIQNFQEFPPVKNEKEQKCQHVNLGLKKNPRVLQKNIISLALNSIGKTVENLSFWVHRKMVSQTLEFFAVLDPRWRRRPPTAEKRGGLEVPRKK
jgi:hypothetical protein